MTIQYLTLLRDNPKLSQDSSPNRPLTLQEIEQLEQLWNNGQPFPIVLREYLFLAGNYNWTFEMEEPLELRASYEYHRNFANFTMPPRPFFVVGQDVTGGGSQFWIVFLDEGAPDPKIYNLNLYENVMMEIHDMERIEDPNLTLSEFINGGIRSFRELQRRGYHKY